VADVCCGRVPVRGPRRLPERVVTYNASSGAGAVTAVLTPDSADGYSYDSSAGAMQTAALSGNTSGNLRTLFWPGGAPAVTDSESCAVWASQRGDLVQQGAGLRHHVRQHRTHPCSHRHQEHLLRRVDPELPHVGHERSQPFEQIGSVNLESLLRTSTGAIVPLPWLVCARVIGEQFEVKVWLNGESEPAWGDSRHGGSVTVPAGWTYAGQAGWYIGHIPPGGNADFTNLATWKYEESSSPSSTTSANGGTTATKKRTTAPAAVRIQNQAP